MIASDPNEIPELVIPSSMISKTDLTRLVSEVEQIDNFLIAANARSKVGVEQGTNVIMSDHLKDFLQVNNLELGDSNYRSRLITKLRQLKDKVPVIYMTFAGLADQESLQKLASWLRQSVHAQAMISVGLQPDLIGGVYIRTTNRVFDMSIRAQLAGNRHLIVEALEGLDAGR